MKAVAYIRVVHVTNNPSLYPSVQSLNHSSINPCIYPLFLSPIHLSNRPSSHLPTHPSIQPYIHPFSLPHSQEAIHRPIKIQEVLRLHQKIVASLWNSRNQAVNLELKVTEIGLCFDTVRTILVISHHNR